MSDDKLFHAAVTVNETILLSLNDSFCYWYQNNRHTMSPMLHWDKKSASKASAWHKKSILNEDHSSVIIGKQRKINYSYLLSETAAVVGMTVAIGVETLDTDDITDAAIGRMDAIARVSVDVLRTGCTERMWGCCDAIGRMFALRGAGCCSAAVSDAL